MSSCQRVVISLVLMLSGCDVGAVDEALVVATTWPAPERAEWERRVHGSAAASPMRWLPLAPGDDLARIATRHDPPDLILGAPALTCERLSKLGLLETSSQSGPWAIVARRKPEAGPLGDPRVDAGALSTCKQALDAGDWTTGYEQLVSGRSEHNRVEGVAAPRHSRHASEARALLNALLADSKLLPAPVPRSTAALEADALLADLLGATLVDARDELRLAWQALSEYGHPAKPRAFLLEPPPWPPASVEKILLTDPHAMPLLETLAAQVAPEAACRGWLLRSWLSPKRLIDGTVLTEIATAANGRLVREPRFRAWLRSEWTAWARQRYRRVARLASASEIAKGG